MKIALLLTIYALFIAPLALTPWLASQR